MSHLKVRQISFQFNEKTPYYWNQFNPYWGNFVNYATLAIPGFERLIIRSVRAAMPKISDPALKQEAELFCQQEAQHTKQHFAHLQALIKQYPGLEDARIEVMGYYDMMFEQESLEFNLAYCATVELWFCPIATFMIENRHQLFRDCDNQVAALILWHFVEEFEHRTSAIDIYNHVVGSYMKRLRMAPKILMHMNRAVNVATHSIQRCVPPLDWQGKAIQAGEFPSRKIFKDLPTANVIKYYYDSIAAQLPFHNPKRVPQPDWVTQWFEDEAAGMDMTVYRP